MTNNRETKSKRKFTIKYSCIGFPLIVSFAIGFFCDQFLFGKTVFSEWIPTIGAILAGLISYYGSKKTTEETLRIQKEISEENNKLQERLQKTSIDANLKANARIDWIQKVREETVKLVSSITRLLDFLPSYQVYIKLKQEFDRIIILDFVCADWDSSGISKLLNVKNPVNISIGNGFSVSFSPKAFEMYEEFEDLQKKRVLNRINELVDESDNQSQNNIHLIKNLSKGYYDKVLSVRLSRDKRMIIAVDEKTKKKKEIVESVEAVSSYLSMNQIQKERDILIDKVKTQANLLELYFGPSNDKRNEKILNEIKNCTKILDKEKIRSSDINHVKSSTDNLVKEMRFYLKQEWDKAKEGK
ncbi:hypothetical protein ACQUFG_06885 [Enterococcus gallinarum]|uniref:hypothetical protein n=1 Tax=Enterococcus gallinarum TaxID=1353 RepID=UPI002A78055A|nr:hypothetical protein [Enterococcus casseliflavus]